MHANPLFDGGSAPPLQGGPAAAMPCSLRSVLLRQETGTNLYVRTEFDVIAPYGAKLLHDYPGFCRLQSIGMTLVMQHV